MPRFVILEHDHPFLHWDFMLEVDGVLRTWRLLEAPQSGRTIGAEVLGDHRLAYLDYEGPVSGERGRVLRWDSGLFTWEAETTERVVVLLAGTHCRGRAILDHSTAGRWTFSCS